MKQEDLEKKIEEILDESFLQAGIILIVPFQEKVRHALKDLFFLLKRNNTKFAEYIKSVENIEHFLMDFVWKWCDEEKVKGDKDETVKLIDKISGEKYQELINKVGKEILNLPYDYQFVFRTNFISQNFKDLDLKINNILTIKGLNSSADLAFQYGLASRFYSQDVNLEAGDQLCFTGDITGYIPAIYPNNDLIDKVIDELKVCIALMNINNIITFKLYRPEHGAETQIGFYRDKKLINYTNLESDFSKKLLDSTLNSDFIFKSPLGLANFLSLTEKVEQNLTDNFISNMNPVIKFFKTFEGLVESDKETRKMFNKFINSLRWYLMSIVNENISISLTSIFVALESLIGSDDRTLGKNREVSERVSLLLGKTIKERRQILEKISNGYRIRNSIMHEGYELSREEESLVLALREYLREIISKEQIILFG